MKQFKVIWNNTHSPQLSGLALTPSSSALLSFIYESCKPPTTFQEEKKVREQKLMPFHILWSINLYEDISWPGKAYLATENSLTSKTKRCEENSSGSSPFGITQKDCDALCGKQTKTWPSFDTSFHQGSLLHFHNINYQQDEKVVMKLDNLNPECELRSLMLGKNNVLCKLLRLNNKTEIQYILSQQTCITKQNSYVTTLMQVSKEYKWLLF